MDEIEIQNRDLIQRNKILEMQLEEKKKQEKPSQLEIINCETLDKLTKIKILSRNQSSEIVEVSYPHPLILKNFIAIAFKTTEEEEDNNQITVDIELLKKFTQEYEILN